MKLVLMRHGQTPWNLEGRFNSTTDIEICAPFDAIERTIPTLLRLNPKLIFSSPMKRCLMTADIVISQLSSSTRRMEVDDRLRETDFGVFEGKRSDEIMLGPYSHEFSEWLDPQSSSIGPPQGETWIELGKRAMDFVGEIQGTGTSTLVITHGYLLRAILIGCLTSLGTEQLRRFEIGNARLAYLTNDDGYWRLRALNISECQDL